MKDRRFSEMKYFPISGEGPAEIHALESERAVELAHEKDLDRIERGLSRHSSVLVVGPKALASTVESCLAKRLPAARWQHVACHPDTGNEARAASARSSAVLELMRALPALLADAHLACPAPILLLRHLDLMAWTVDNHPRHEFNDLVYWLNEFPDVLKVAFWDPAFVPPKVIEELFPARVSLEILDRELLWKLVSPLEARKISPIPETFSMPAQLTLYQYFSGVNVAEIRRTLRSLPERNFSDCRTPGDANKVFDYIRTHAAPGEVLPSGDWGEVVGYRELREELDKKVLFPFRLRQTASDERELKQADAIVPRGLILHGPPGVGKTRWMRYLASALGAKLIVVHGPELKNKYVGETEAAIRRLFIRARRFAPSLILIDEIDALTPSRETSGNGHFEASMAGQFLTEMDGLHKDEAVLVAGSTNRIDAVDRAFKRPGRFGLVVFVDYPRKVEDRRAILSLYDERYGLNLAPESIDDLAEKTGQPLDLEGDKARRQWRDAYIERFVGREYFEKAGPQLSRALDRGFGVEAPAMFSGDHLRAVCLYLAREHMYRKSMGREYANGIDNSRLLAEAVESVREKGPALCEDPVEESGTHGEGYSAKPWGRFTIISNKGEKP